MRFSEQRWDAFGGSLSESSAHKFGTRGVAISARKPQLSAAETLLLDRTPARVPALPGAGDAVMPQG